MRRPHWISFVAACTACGSPALVDDAGSDAGADAGVACREAHSVAVHGGCRCASDCAGESICQTEAMGGFPGGECLPPPCATPEECPAGDLCLIPVGQEMGVCRVACTTSADCPEARRCLAGSCAPWCDADAQCESGHCNPYTHRCDDGPPREGADNGEPCLNDDDCSSEICDRENLGGRCTSLCTSETASCPEGSACIFNDGASTLGICMSVCTALLDCDDGLDCVQVAYPPSVRVCLVEPDGVGCRGRETILVDGAPCTCADDCSLGFRCIEEWLSDAPHGVCVRACDAMGMRVSDDPSCGDGLLCHDWVDTPISEGGGACFARCTTSADCALGRVCSLAEGCVPFCQSDDECDSGTCDRYRGRCTPNASPELGAIGASCDSDFDCRAVECRQNATAGFCTAACDVGRQACLDGAVCVDVGDGSMGRCMPACTIDTDCATPTATCMPSGAGLRSHCDIPDPG